MRANFLLRLSSTYQRHSALVNASSSSSSFSTFLQFAHHWPLCRQFGTETGNSNNNSHKRSKNSAAELRQSFLDFFTSRGHQRLPSAPVLAKHGQYNQSDFICAGVQQFVPVLLGQSPPPANRVVNSQKCIRLVDKDLVGLDNQHHTFFEMLGNWSFGDYHKEEACTWAWEFLTQTLQIDPTRLYITYFGGDEQFEADLESRDIWRRVGVPDTNLLPCGADSNFWTLGPTGPCGPCTEIHVDKSGQPPGTVAHLVNADDPSVIELWNIVFMQYDRHYDGTLTPLPLKKVVDTGLGLERLCALMQDCQSAYESDLFRPLVQRICELSPLNPVYQGRLDPHDEDGIDTAIRVVCDHMRTIVVAMALDGFQITSTKKYARKVKDLFKKTALVAHQKLKMPHDTLAELVPAVVEQLGDAHPDLQQNEQVVVEKVRTEEARMWAQREVGERKLKKMLASLLKEESGTFPGKFAYKLVHQYRLELDLIQELAADRGLPINMEEFDQLVAERKRKTSSHQQQ